MSLSVQLLIAFIVGLLVGTVLMLIRIKDDYI